MKLAAVFGSPLPRGATRKALDTFLEAVESNADVTRLDPSRAKVNPCIHCGACIDRGYCVIEDDAPEMLEKILHSDVALIASPVYFAGMPAGVKALIDRAQVYWNMRFIRKEDPGADVRRAALLSTCGSRRDYMFDCIRRSVYYFYESLGVKFDREKDFLGFRRIESARDFDEAALGSIRSFAEDICGISHD